MVTHVTPVRDSFPEAFVTGGTCKSWLNFSWRFALPAFGKLFSRHDWSIFASSRERLMQADVTYEDGSVGKSLKEKNIKN